MNNQEREARSMEMSKNAPEKKGALGRIKDSLTNLWDTWRSSSPEKAKKQAKEAVHMMSDLAAKREQQVEASIRNTSEEARKIEPGVDVAALQQRETELLTSVRQEYQGFQDQANAQAAELELTEADLDEVEPVDELAARREGVLKTGEKNPERLPSLKEQAEREEVVEDLSRISSKIKIETTEIMNQTMLKSKSKEEVQAITEKVRQSIEDAQALFDRFVQSPPRMKDKEFMPLIRANQTDLMIRAAGLRDGMRQLERRTDISPAEKNKQINELRREAQNCEAVSAFKGVVANEVYVLTLQADECLAEIASLKSQYAEAQGSKDEVKAMGLKKKLDKLNGEEVELRNTIAARRQVLEMKPGSGISAKEVVRPLSYERKLQFESYENLSAKHDQATKAWEEKVLKNDGIYVKNSKRDFEPLSKNTTTDQLELLLEELETENAPFQGRKDLSDGDKFLSVHNAMLMAVVVDLLETRHTIDVIEKEMNSRFSSKTAVA